METEHKHSGFCLPSQTPLQKISVSIFQFEHCWHFGCDSLLFCIHDFYALKASESESENRSVVSNSLQL